MSAFTDAVLMIALPGFICGTAGLGEIKHRMKIVLPLLITDLADVLDGGLMRDRSCTIAAPTHNRV